LKIRKPKINFFSEEIDFNFKRKQKHKDWLISVANSEGFSISALNYIFSNDDYLLKINQDFLQHDTYTDIITFDNSSQKGKIDGEIYISVDRIKENAQIQQIGFDSELHRVMAHGLLHLCGYKDKSEADIKKMREKEDEAIEKFVNA